MPEQPGASPRADPESMPDEVITREAGKLSSFDPANRTVDLVLATENPVRRRSWDVGTFDEILVVSPAAIDTSRLNSMVLLDQHDAYSGLESRLGSIVPGSLRFEGKTAIVTAKISRNEKGEALFRDLEDQHVLACSVGYKISTQTRTEAPAGGTSTVRVTRWSPVEISIVSVGADPGASTRSQERNTMPEAIVETVVVATRAENSYIRSTAKKAGLDQAWTDAMIDAEPTVDAVNAAALAAMTERSAATAVRTSVHVGTDHNDPDAIRSAMSDALAHRLAPGAVKLEGRATEYRGHGLLDMAGDIAIARGDRGVNLRDKDSLLQRAVGAHSTSDFPLLVANAANKALLAQYQVAAPTYRMWAARKNFADFKEHSFLRVGDVPAFKEIQEGGETKYGTVSENAEKITAKEYGTGLALGRRLLMNDDLSALSDFTSGIATRAANDENRLAYGVLSTNAALSSGVALFHASHGNLAGSGSTIDAGLSVAVAALRAQKSLDGMVLNLQPAWLVCGPAQEVHARRALAEITPTKSSDVNVWAGIATLIVDAEITGNEWYLFTSPATPVIVYGYVAGSEGPVVRSERCFDSQALKVAASLDVAFGAIDFRGAYRNAGA